MELTHEEARTIIAGLDLDLRQIPDVLHDQACKAWNERNARMFLGLTDSRLATVLLYDNVDLLEEHDNQRFVADLVVQGWILSRFYHHRFSDEWSELFAIPPRGALIEAGEPIPAGPWPRILYRWTQDAGDRGAVVDGFSWTGTREVAETLPNRRGQDPVILERLVVQGEVLFYLNQRGEDEYVLAVE